MARPKQMVDPQAAAIEALVAGVEMHHPANARSRLVPAGQPFWTGGNFRLYPSTVTARTSSCTPRR